MRLILILAFLTSTANGAQRYLDKNASLSVAGTPQQITASSTASFRCTVFAPSSNAGVVYVSPASVSATISAGIELAAGGNYKEESTSSRDKIDPSDWYFNGDNAGDEVLIHCAQ